MKKFLLLLILALSVNIINAQLNFTKTDQGLLVSTGTGDPTHAATFGATYTNTVNGQTWIYKTVWARVPSGSTFLDIQADAGIVSTGIDTGFTITGLLATTYTVAPGVGYITTGFGPTKITQKVTYAGSIGITPSFSSGAILLNSSGTLIQLDILTITDSAKRDNIFLGGYGQLGGTILALQNTPSLNNRGNSRFESFGNMIGAIKGGNLISANGSNLQLNKSAGHTWRLSSNYVIDPTLPDVTTDTSWTSISGGFSVILGCYRDGSGGFSFKGYSGVEPDSIDNDSGALVAVSANKWTIPRLYFFNATSTYIYYYGQTEYNDLSACIIGIDKEEPVIDPTTNTGQLLSSICVKRLETALNSADTQIENTNKFGDH